jgi:very-short-patch-repair endonuclease
MSHLEDSFECQLKAFGLPPGVREYRFHPVRKWRLDFFWEENRWAVEIHGGGWVNGGHNRNPRAMWRDYEKINTAQELGIRVLQFTGDQIKDGTAVQVMERIFK